MYERIIKNKELATRTLTMTENVHVNENESDGVLEIPRYVVSWN